MGQFASPWPFTGWCGSNCILSPCLWLSLYLKIWTTVRRCFHIEFWEYFLVGLLADIMAIVPDGMYYAHLVENMFDLLVSTFINKKRNFFLQEQWEQISFVTNFNFLGFGQPVTSQNVILTQNGIKIAAKCNTNAKCNNIDAKCNKIFNATCNNLSTQIVITFLTHNVIISE